MQMHENAVVTDAALVRGLLQGQFPQWADLPLEPVDSHGTDHDIYRLGHDLSIRLPRIGWATKQAAKEAEWLPRIAPHLPLAVPVPISMGKPDLGYPYVWSIYEWLPGETAGTSIFDLQHAAVDLAAFVTALRKIDTTAAHDRPTAARGAPLHELDEQVHRSMERLGERIDGESAGRIWNESLSAEPWAADELWVHGDLLPGNLLAVDGRLSAVIDFGGLNTGDPACDLQPAWNLFTGQSRARFREELGVEEDSWQRGRGWVVYQTVSALAYYWDTNQDMVRQASFALEQVLNE